MSVRQRLPAGNNACRALFRFEQPSVAVMAMRHCECSFLGWARLIGVLRQGISSWFMKSPHEGSSFYLLSGAVWRRSCGLPSHRLHSAPVSVRSFTERTHSLPSLCFCLAGMNLFRWLKFRLLWHTCPLLYLLIGMVPFLFPCIVVQSPPLAYATSCLAFVLGFTSSRPSVCNILT